MTEQDLVSLIEEVLEERKKKRKKKSKKKKEDRCTRIAKRKYDVWPSAYASGAVVKCRQGKIWKDLKEEKEDNTFFSVTPSHNVESIASSGLDPSYGGQNYSQGGYVDHTVGKIFLTSKSGLFYWHDKISNIINDRFDDPKESFPVILKVNVQKELLKKDELGEKDSRHEAFFYEGVIDPENLSWWDGENWRQMTDWDFEEAKENENLVDVDYDDDGEIEWSDFPFPDTLSEEDEAIEEKRKLTKKPSSETSLRDWFKRKGEPGKGGGWVDCNSPIRKDGKITGYKSCGRSGKDDKRSKYPACRPTPSACKSKGRGKSWGKKSAKGMKETMNNLQEQILTEVMQLLESTNISEGMQYHLDNQIPITETIYRPLSEGFMRLMKEARTLYSLGLYEGLTEDEREILESDLGEVGVYEGQEVPLDLPMMDEPTPMQQTEDGEYLYRDVTLSAAEMEEYLEKESKNPDFVQAVKIGRTNPTPYGDPVVRFFYNNSLSEAKYKGKDVKLNKPQRGGSKKFYVYVRDPKSGNIRKVSFGDPNLSVKIKDPERRKSFVARHKCKEKKDKTTAGYWACRVGRYPHLFGGKTRYTWW
jgi:hypothetical protein